MITAVKWLPDHQGFVTSSHDMSLIYWVSLLLTVEALANPSQTWSGTLRSTINTSPVRIESLVVCPARNRLVAAGFISLPERANGVRAPTASRTPDQKPPPINGHEPSTLVTDSEFELMQRTLIVYDLNRPGLEKRWVSFLLSYWIAD